MATIITRETGATAKGSPLTNTEVDNNFININTSKLELGQGQSSGTANGILYLDGDKTVSSGNTLVLNSGNVGIGTTSPSQKLQVVGAIESKATNDYRGIRLEAGIGNPQAIKAINYLGASYTADLAFHTDSGGVNSEKMRILGNGNVGIGTSAPSVLLQLFKTQNADTTLTVVNQDTGSFGSASVQTGSDSATAILLAYGSGFTPSGVRLASSAALFTSAATTGGLSIGARNAAGVIRFSTGGDTERMRIDSSGNVGIGTSSPSSDALLTVNGSIKITDTNSLLLGFQSEQRIFAAGTANSTYLTFSQWISGSYTERMRIDSSGNVGIGTNTPGFRLDTQSVAANGIIAKFAATAANTALIAFSDNTPTNIGPQLGSVGNSLVFLTNSTGSAAERMRINSSGNVGIGTNNPSIRLHVENAAGSYNSTADNNIALYLKSSSAAATNNFQGIQFAALSGNSNNSAFTIGISSPATGYSPDLIFSQRTGLSTWVERMHIDGSGNLGIGTSSPARILHVASANPTAFFDRDAGNPGTIGLRGSRGTLSAPTQSLAGDTLGTLAGFGYTNSSAFTSAGISNITFYAAEALTNSAQGSYITFSTTPIGTVTPAERMLISSTGNIGIGTNNPAMRLDVRGTPDVSNSSRRLIYVSDTTTGATAGVGSGISFAGIFDLAGTVSTFGGIQAQKENSTSGNQSGYLSFITNSSGTQSEKMRIDSSGNVGIGTSSIAVRLQLADSSATVYTSTSASLAAPKGVVGAENTNITTGAYSGITLSAKNANNNSAIGYIGVISEPTDYVCDIVFGSRTGATAYAERMRIDSTGNVGIGLATPVNKLDISGSFGRGAPVTKTTSFTLAATENWLICNGAGTITVTLPAASSWTGREVMIKTIAAQTVVSASSNVVPLTGGAAGTAILAATAGKWATLVSDGTNWVIMSAA